MALESVVVAPPENPIDDKTSSPGRDRGDNLNGEETNEADAGAHAEAPKTDHAEDVAKSSPDASAASERKDEMVFIQDVGFTVKIVSPGSDSFDIQVSSMELVQEIHQLLMDREDTCHRTCFSLQLDGNTLDNFAELKNVDGLKEGSVIRVVEEPYTMREARIHVRHVRDLLKSLDPADAYNGVECSSLTFLNTITQGDILEKKRARNESVDCTPPSYIMPVSRECPLLPLQPQCKDQKVLPCIKVITTSAWNPPPGHRKIHGDLMYLYVVTLEDKHYHISACARGFYINLSTDHEFNPKAATPSHLCHSLIELLNQISPLFKKNFAALQKKRSQRHPFERVATPYQVYTWAAPMMEHTLDAIRAEDTFSSKLGYEEHIPGQTRDWNEELQTTRELPRKNLPERLLRERAIFKVHSDFVAAATRGAMAVIDGNVMAINPGEEAKMQMFIWNNIFFSLGFDVRDHYKELGGDAAAFVAPRNDLQGVRVYNTVDLPGLYTLGTVVIDYRGYRVTAQSIIPGILEREQEQSVVYGSIDFGKTVLTHPKYLELLNKAGQQLKILNHHVLNENNEPVELCSSVECKGIIGNDGRHYILDLLRTFPPDVNFLIINEERAKSTQALGFPIEHKHKLCCLRQELIDSFIEMRYMMFIKYAAYRIQQMNHRRSEDLAQKQQQGENKEIESNKQLEDKTIDADKDKREPSPDHAEEETKECQETIKIQEKTTEEVLLEKSEAVEAANEDTNASLAELVSAGQKQQESVEPEDQEKKDISKDDKPNGASGEKDEGDIETEEAKKLLESIKSDNEENTQSIIKVAAGAVGSLKETEFDIRFNPDVYSPGIRHCENLDPPLALQKQLVKDAADFLLTVQIPAFIRDSLDHSSAPMDGFTLSEALHNKGINIRYLGKVCNLLNKVVQLEYLYNIAVGELILRGLKHIFVAYLQATELTNLSAAVAHFLNCFLYSGPLNNPLQGVEDNNKNRKRNRRRGRGANPLVCADSNEWANLTPKSLWAQLKAELTAYFDFDTLSSDIESTLELYSLKKISLLCSFCKKTGLQILMREYNFESKNKPIFVEEDVLNIFPVVKHINPRASDAFNFYTTGQTKIQQGQLREGYELITEALNLLNNVYGAMHPEIAQCLRMIARLNYIMGEHFEAMAYQQKAVLMSERVNGIDHPYTITEYTHMALYCFANNHITVALKMLYRARYLALLVCGEIHPEVALLDNNIALILHAVGEYELSLRFIESALSLYLKFYGDKSLKVAVCYHLVARTHSCMGNFRHALHSEKEAYGIYKSQLGENHEKTRESSDCLFHLTNQAVILQKKMNQLYTGKGGAPGLPPPLQITPPPMGSVLEMLNVINGIIFVQISQEDIDNLKAEMAKQSAKQLQDEQQHRIGAENGDTIDSGGDEEDVKAALEMALPPQVAATH